MFFDPVHRRIFDTIQKKLESGAEYLDPTTLQGYLQEPLANGLVPAEYVRGLYAQQVSPKQAKAYASEIRNQYFKRELISIGEGMAIAAREAAPHEPAENLITRFENAIAELKPQANGHSIFGTMRTAGLGAFKHAEISYKAAGIPDGVVGRSTGFPVLDDAIGGLQSPDLVVIGGRPGMGKCQDVDSPVLLASGEWVRMGDLKFGDQLASIDGRPSMVAGIYPQGVKQNFRITFSDGRSATCSGDHLWQISYRDWDEPRVMTADDLRTKLQASRYKNRLYVPLVNGSFGDERDLPIDPYLLGALLGNGCFRGGNSVRFSSVDANTISQVVEALDDEMKISVAGNCDFRLVKSHRCTRDQSELRQKLEDLGLWGLGSHEKFVPPVYLKAYRDSRVRLLQGLMDTDGWVEKGGAVRFLSTSRKMAENVVDLVRSLGGLASIKPKESFHTYKGERRTAKTGYLVTIRHQNGDEFFTLQRKSSRAVRASNTVLLNVVSVEPDGQAEMQCIMVTHPSRLYVTQDYVVTHNTALATNIAVNVAGQLAQGEGIIAFVSLEMSKEQVAHRVISDKANVAGWKFRRGKVDQNDMERYADAKYQIDSLPLHFVDKSGMNVGEIRSSLRHLQKEHGLVLVVVDYIQIIAGMTDKDSQYRYSLVTAAVAALKQMAKEFKVPVIALSQLSRGVDARDDKRPNMSDLKESGGIEQDADTIMLLYREEYYLRRQEPRKGTMQWEKWRSKLQPVEGIAEVIVAKNRHGPESTVLMGFEASYTRFVNDVPQRDERPDPDQEERRIRGVGKRAADAMFYLKDMIDIEGIRIATGNLAKVQERGIPYDTWESRFRASLKMTDNDVKRYLNSVVPELERADLIKIRDHEGQRYVWLTSKGEVWR
jgi:replicative DNA helicase